MTPVVYASFRRFTLSFVAVLFLTLGLSACMGNQPYYSPWVMSRQVETKGVAVKPDDKPFFGWQTDSQRREFANPMPVPSPVAPATDGTTTALEDPITSAAYPTPETADAATPALQTTFEEAFSVPKTDMSASPARTAALQTGQKVTVALLLPLSGKNAALGKAMLNAAQLAFFDIGYDRVKLMPRDTGDTAIGATKAVSSAVKSGVDLVLGPVFSEQLQAVRPIAAAAQVPVISFSTDWKQAGGDTYVMGFLPFAQISRVVNYAHDKGYNRFAVFSPQSEYSDVVLKTLYYALDQFGLRTVQTGTFSPLQPDLIQIVSDFVNVRLAEGEHGKPGRPLGAPAPAFDALVLPMGGESLKSVTNILNYYNLDSKTVRLLGTGLWDDPALLREVSLYGGWFAASDPALRSDFERRYRETYQMDAPRLATLAYDATAMAAVLAQSAGDGEDAFGRDRLTSTRGFAGIDGIFRFRPDGLVERGLAVLEVRSNGFKVIDPAPSAFIGLTN